MNWDQLKGKWHELKGSIRAEWGDLTDQELEQIDGEREKLVGLIQQHYGRTKEQAEEEVDNWSGRL